MTESQQLALEEACRSLRQIVRELHEKSQRRRTPSGEKAKILIEIGGIEAALGALDTVV